MSALLILGLVLSFFIKAKKADRSVRSTLFAGALR